MITLLKDILEKDKPVRFQVRGSSMFPAIRNDDIICISPLGGKSPATGEVVAFVHQPGNRLLVHRVVQKKSGGLKIKGDNNRTFDSGIIEPSNILGRLTRLERKGRKVRFGMGPERIMIAWMSRTGTLRLIKKTIKPFYRLFFKKRT